MLSKLQRAMLWSLTLTIASICTVSAATKKIKKCSRYSNSVLTRETYYGLDEKIHFVKSYSESSISVQAMWYNTMGKCVREIIMSDNGYEIYDYGFDSLGHQLNKFGLKAKRNAEVPDSIPGTYEPGKYTTREEVLNDPWIQNLMKTRKSYMMLEYTYDDQGNVLTQTTGTISGTRYLSIMYIYDDIGHSVFEEYHGAGVVVGANKFTYDSLGRIVSKTTYDKDNIENVGLTLTYNAEGQLLESRKTIKGSLMLTDRRTYTDGKLTRAENLGPSGVLEMDETYSYNENGDLRTKVTTMPGGYVTTVTMKYSYY